MADLEVEFAALQTAASDIRAGAGRIRARLDELDDRLRPLQSDWTGSASEAYEQARRRWTTALADMQHLLDDIGRAVDSSHDGFASAETSNTRRWG